MTPRIPVVVLAVALGAALTAGDAAARRSAAARAVPGVGIIRLGESASLGAAHFPASSYVILSPHMKQYARWTRALNPATRTLAYKSSMDLDMTPMCRAATAICRTGVTYAEAQAHDAGVPPAERWVLTETSGAPFVSQAYPDNALADVGSPSFQQRWIANVSTFLRKSHFSGLFIDNVLGSVSGWSDGRYPAKYPSDAAWQQAMASFIGRVGAALRKQGYFVAANAYKPFPQTAAWWRQIAPATDALMSEYWQQDPNNPSVLYTSDAASWTGHWDYWESLVEIAQRAGSSFFGLQFGDPSDRRLMRFGRASFLLAWNGTRGAYFFSPRAEVDPWQQAWTADVGRPVAPRYRVGYGWRRDFAQGTVLLNPSSSHPQAFALGGRYILPDGGRPAAVTLEATTALILRRG
jgi:hypothetical protein